MTTREDFEASVDQWISQLRHFCDSAARKVEQLDKLIEGGAATTDSLLRSELAGRQVVEAARPL
jgi:hypothetical protein